MKVLIGMIFAIAMSLTEVYAQNTAVTWSTFNMGFAGTMSATTNAQSVAGQLVVGSTQSSNTGTETGFLPGASGSPPLPATFSVTTVSDTGAGSLRWAMQTANTTPGLNLIDFNIPGSGVHTITPASALPTVSDPTIIDGYTQPGASPNTNPPNLGSNAILLIELNGINSGGGNGAAALKLQTTGCTVRGLVINRAPSSGIALAAGGNHVIEGNFIGTNSSGTVALGNFTGIAVDLDNGDFIGGVSPGASNVISGNIGEGISFGGSAGNGGSNHVVQGNLIGTNAAGTGALGNAVGIRLAFNVNNVLMGDTIPSARNIISGNTTGISINNGLGSPQVPRNRVQGNYIGTDVSGMVAIGNTQDGVDVYGLNNTIGGTLPGEGNLISGNGRFGVQIFGGDGSTVEGNNIGTDVTGTSALGNHDIGVSLTARNVRVGGTGSGAGNIIAFNGTTPGSSAGVAVIGASSRNAILGNSIFSNAGLGIDLGSGFSPNGVTPNDSCDIDTLVPNNYQNYPVLTSALPDGGNTIVTGTLNSAPNNIFRIEFFSSSTPDSTGYGEGTTFLGFTTVGTGNNCLVSFVDTLMTFVPMGYYISATATDTGNNTSEFSGGLQLGTTSVQHPGIDLPARYSLEQNYPNPFNPTTTIRYDLPLQAHVTLKVYDVLGREILTLVDKNETAGSHSTTFNASHFPSGIYFYRIQSGEFSKTKKLILLK